MKATLLMTNSFAAYLQGAQREMVYTDFECPASTSLPWAAVLQALPGPDATVMAAARWPGGARGSDGQRACPVSGQVLFPVVLPREAAAPAPPPPGWDGGWSCSPSLHLAALFLPEDGLQNDQKKPFLIHCVVPCGDTGSLWKPQR